MSSLFGNFLWLTWTTAEVENQEWEKWNGNQECTKLMVHPHS